MENRKKKISLTTILLFTLFVVLFFEKYTRVLDYVSESQARMDVGNAENIMKYVKK